MVIDSGRKRTLKNRIGNGIKVILLTVAAAFLFMLTPVNKTEAEAAAVSGIDVSSYQGVINWNAVAASGVKFAMVRVGNTKYGLDKYFVQNVVGANAAGIRVGAYVYSYAMNPAEAAADAQLAVSAMGNLPISFPVAIDIEDPSQVNLSQAEQLAIVNTFCSVIYAAGYQPMVYSYKNWLATKLGVTAWDHWVANYSGAIGFPGTMWQYSSSGAVPGIAGNCDVNYVMKDYFTTIPATGLSTQNGATYYFVNYRKQFGMQTIGGLQYFFDGTGAMVKNQTTVDGQNNIIRMCKDGHVVVITAAAQAQAAQLKAISDQQSALLVQCKAAFAKAQQDAAAGAAQYRTLQAAADQAALTSQQAAAQAAALPTQENLNIQAVAAVQAQQAADAARTAQAAAAQLQQAAQTAAATEASQETAAAKALQDSNTAQLAIAIPQ